VGRKTLGEEWRVKPPNPFIFSHPPPFLRKRGANAPLKHPQIRELKRAKPLLGEPGGKTDLGVAYYPPDVILYCRLKTEYSLRACPPKEKPRRQADRVSLETAVPPVFGKESAHAIVKSM
jgi:hypothetical protein